MEDPERSPLNWQIPEALVDKAIKLAKDGTAAGLDGCPNELWKELDKRYQRTLMKNKPGFDIVKTLTTLFQDIQENGVDERLNFAEGWMCPIFKKKDPTDISNYRPITVLNTDYKILTKTLGLQLLEPADKMIHEDQAGFMPGRSIFNHIRLAKAIISYADISEEDGAIVALDQEKAYDKIQHGYLWRVLEAFSIPLPFIKIVKSLYQNAQTRVAINGILSRPFRVTRGVRQGDPLSCPLFDLAIEPLACMLRNDPEIHGLRIPGLMQKLIVKLFTDNTNLYLSKRDRLDHIQSLLDIWCAASGAKFNIEKTEIIPIGTQQFRHQVIESRKLNHLDRNPLPDRIQIANEGDAIRILGAWIGNKINDLTAWEPILDKIKENLQRWKRTHPTLNGKRIIIQAVIGGMTQFLTQAQGMPQRIEAAINKIITQFIWDESSAPRIAAEHLQRPIEEGGLNLLNIRSRNEAIELMWLKTYLNFSPKRQPWAVVTDLIIDAAAPTNTIKHARKNPFLQSWNTPTRGPKAALINDDIRRMLTAAKKHGANLAAIKLTPHLRAQLPAFYHLLTNHRPSNNRQSKCLLEKHNVVTVADLIKTSARLNVGPNEYHHRETPFCECDPCIADQENGCYNPHECASEAQTRLQQIPPRLNPKNPGERQDGLSLTRTRKLNNETARQNNGRVTFDPSLTCKDSISECFRIFVDPSQISHALTQRIPGRNPTCETCVVYTEGTCVNSGKSNAACGSGVWFSQNNQHNAALRILNDTHSKQVGEIAAIIVAASATPKSQPLVIVTTSKYAVDGLTTHLEAWENQGWIGIKNAPLFKKAASILRQRSATTMLQWTRGHEDSIGTEQSKRLASEGARKHTRERLNLEIPNKFNLQGAKLTTLTQALAYRGIQENKEKTPRLSTERNLDLTREAIRRHTDELEPDATIWSNLRRKAFRPRVRQFLYKSMHSTYKIGNFWSNIPDNEHRQLCQTCNITETMEHILTRCTSRPPQIIWPLAKSLWPHSEQRWPEISLGTILGVGCMEVKKSAVTQNDDNSSTDRGASRLLHILVSESAHLIWVLRCDRVINEITHCDNEIRSRWYKAINNRLTEDQVIATKIKRTKGFTELVVNTWEHVLKRYGDIPNEWLQSSSEVLVGIGPRGLRHEDHVP
jgi:ribonuclease HI